MSEGQRRAGDSPEHVAARLALWVARRQGIALVSYRDRYSLQMTLDLLTKLCTEKDLALQTLDLSTWSTESFAQSFDTAKNQLLGPWSVVGFAKLLPLVPQAFEAFIVQLNLIRDRLHRVPQIWWVPPYMVYALSQFARDLDSFFQVRLDLAPDPYRPFDPTAECDIASLDQALSNPQLRESGAYLASYLNLGGDPEKVAEPTRTWLARFAYLPEAVALGERFAKLGGQLDQPLDLPEWTLLPFGRNPGFVGRAEELEQLARLLEQNELVALVGMAGVGKTQLAVEYVFHYGKRYGGGIFWLNAAEQASLEEDIATCGPLMRLFPDNEHLGLDQRVAQVLELWQRHIASCLIVLDNCEDDAMLDWARNHLPKPLLVTSRRIDWADRWPALNVTLLARTDSVRLLQSCDRSLADHEAAAIAEELGDLPLALFLAGRYLEERHTDPAQYLGNLKEGLSNHPSLTRWASIGYQPTHYELGVVRSFHLSYDRLDPQRLEDRLAQNLLLHACCFAPGQPILRVHLYKSLGDQCNKELGELALGRLFQLGLVEPTKEKLSIHRLVAFFCQELNPEAWRKAEDDVINTVLDIAQRANLSGLPLRMADILSHLRYLANRYKDEHTEASAELTLALADYLRTSGVYHEAEVWYRRSLTVAETIFGPEHPKTARRIDGLRLTQRRLEEHESLFSSTLVNLARMPQGDLRHAKKKPIHRRALRHHPEERHFKKGQAVTAGNQQDSQSGDRPSAFPDWFHLPHRRNRHIVGRGRELEALAQSLNQSATAITPMSATTGLGGIGKTQLAVEYAYRYAHRYPGGVFWLNCEFPAAVASEIAACGETMKLYGRDDQIQLTRKIQTVLARWRQDSRQRLLVFDNCEDEQVLREWLPHEPHIHVLVTSRRSWPQHWGMMALQLQTLSRPDSISLLKAHRDDLTHEDADRIAAELGDLPLALYLAGCYLDTYRATISPSAYLEALRQAPLNHGSLLGRGMDGYQPTDHDSHVAQTFATSFSRLEPGYKVDALARELLLRASFLAPGAPFGAEHLADEDSDPEQLGEALYRLCGLGLLRREGQSFVIHRLLSYFCQNLSQGEHGHKAEAIVADRVAYLSSTALLTGLPVRMTSHLPHLRHLAERYAHVESTIAARLSNELGQYLDMIGAYGEAERWYRFSLACAERIYGPAEPETANRLNNMAGLLYQTHRLQEAEPLYRRALAIDEATLGPNHPNVARDLNNLAEVLRATQRLAEVEPLYRRALAIDEAALGNGHPMVAIRLNNLAGLLLANQRLDEAEALYRRALAINEAALGVDHPATASILNNLAELLRATQRLTEAESLFHRALAIDEAALGPDHPTVAIHLSNLAGLLRATHRLAEAESLYRRALAIIEPAMGPDHPKVAISLNNLADLLRATNRFAEAEPLLLRAVSICLTTLGPEHPWTQTMTSNLKKVQEERTANADD